MRDLVLFNSHYREEVANLCCLELKRTFFVIFPFKGDLKKKRFKEVVGKELSSVGQRFNIINIKCDEKESDKRPEHYFDMLSEELEVRRKVCIDLYEIDFNSKPDLLGFFLNNENVKRFFITEKIDVTELVLIINTIHRLVYEEHSNLITGRLINLLKGVEAFLSFSDSVLKNRPYLCVTQKFFNKIKTIKSHKYIDTHYTAVSLFLRVLPLLVLLTGLYCGRWDLKADSTVCYTLFSFSIINMLLSPFVIESLVIDLFCLQLKLAILCLSPIFMLYSHLKKRTSNFYLLINDLYYSPDIREIFFKNESTNKKLFIIPVFNFFLVSLMILFCVKLVVQIVLALNRVIIRLLENAFEIKLSMLLRCLTKLKSITLTNLSLSLKEQRNTYNIFR